MPLIARQSITWRLTLLFALVSSSVLVALGFAIAASVEKHFELQDMEVLNGKLELVRHAFEEAKSQDAIERVAHQLADSLIGHTNLELIVLSPNRDVMYTSPNAHFPIGLLAASTNWKVRRSVTWTYTDQIYRGIAAELPTGIVELPQVIVAVSINTAHHQAFMRSFVKGLWIFVVSAAALSGTLGWVAVRRGLAPLRVMRDQTRGITAHQLSRRLPLEPMPTELAGLALSLNAMLAQLEEAFRRLSGFSSDIAHELRTPVSNLMTQTQVALSRQRSADEYRRILESNTEEFERLAKMISDMLLLAKAENTVALPNLETILLAAEFRALFDYYEAVAKEKELSFVCDGDGRVNADRPMLRRALGNLLSNAVRHSTSGTTVYVSVKASQDMVEICVANTGDAIAQEHLERVFERFFRVDPARQESKEGTGLGLAITRSIISAHGGTIVAASSQGLTSFTIRLPRIE